MIISNTTPLSSLTRIGQSHILAELYGQITIPRTVAFELDQGRYAVGDWRGRVSEFVTIVDDPPESSLTQLLARDVDPGEAAAIALAVEASADLLIIDDLAGRRAAARLGLTLTGTVGLILLSAEEGLISKPFDVIHDLRTRGGLWLSDSFLARLKKAYVSSKNSP